MRDGSTGADGATGPRGLAGTAGTDGTNGVAGTNGTNGTNGSSSPAGLGGFLYTSNDTAETVPIEADVIFNTPAAASAGFTHFAGTSTIEVDVGGTYKVSFSVTGVQPNQFTVFDNGAPVAGTTYGSDTGQTNGQAIIQILQGDTMTLRNHTSISAVTLETAAGGAAVNVNASMTLERLTP